MEKLPAELLLQIASNVSLDRNPEGSSHTEGLLRQQALLPLCLTSRAIYETAVSELYAHFDWIGNSVSLTRLLVRTLCMRPELARHVHSCTIASTPGWVQRELAPPSERRIRQFRTIIGDLISQQFYRGLYDSLAMGCRHADPVLFMMLVQRVRNIDVVMPSTMLATSSRFGRCPCKARPMMEEALYYLFHPERLSRLPHGAYCNLKDIAVRSLPSEFDFHSPRDEGISYQVLNSVLQLPSIERLTCNNLVKKASSLSWTCPEMSNNLRELHFDLGCVDTAVFAQMIRTCRSLERLTIRPKLFTRERPWRYYALNPAPPQILVSMPDFQHALSQHCETLTYLQLSDRFEDGWYWNNHSDCPAINLTHFAELKTLVIDQQLLYPKMLISNIKWPKVELDSVLPPNLEDLIIYCPFDIRTLPEVLETFETYSNVLLRRLKIVLPARHPSGFSRPSDLLTKIAWRTAPDDRAWKTQVIRDFGIRNYFEFSVDIDDLMARGISYTVVQHALRAAYDWPAKGV